MNAIVIEGWDSPVHPAANLFPMMSDEDIDALAKSIREQGLRQPIILTEDGQLLDGRNRVAACSRAGVPPRHEVYRGDDPVAYVMALNMDRRHLNEGQKAFLALKIMPMYEAEALARQAAAGRSAAPGKPQKDVADRPHLSKRAPLARDKAAAAVGTSGRSVARAKRIEQTAPELAEQVWAGTLALDKADKQVARRLKEQQEQEARNVVMAQVPSDAIGERWRLYQGDFRERLADLPDGCVDLIVTDPPYPAEFMDLWADLAKHAARVLKPQGVLVALTGNIMLPSVLASLAEHLSWGWMYVQPLPGANSRIMGRHVLQSFKPWIAYSNGTWPSGTIDWHPDLLDPSSRAKDRYRWEQDPDPAKMLIDALSPENGTVLDPYAGTGSYGIAALAMGRNFIGIEADAARFAQSCERLSRHV